MLREGQVLVGPQFSEPMVVETVRAYVDTWVVGLVGEHTRQFRRVTLTRDDLQAIRILARIRSRPCTATCSNRVACSSSWPTTQGPGRRSWLAFCCGN